MNNNTDEPAVASQARITGELQRFPSMTFAKNDLTYSGLSDMVDKIKIVIQPTVDAANGKVDSTALTTSYTVLQKYREEARSAEAITNQAQVTLKENQKLLTAIKAWDDAEAARLAAEAAANDSSYDNYQSSHGGSCPTGYETLGGGGDLASFANTYNAIRVANCMTPLPASNFYWSGCIETRLNYLADTGQWGHFSSVPGQDGQCDSNLAGGVGNTGATVAQKWWDSPDHRASLYRGGVGCVAFAMTQNADGLNRGGAVFNYC